MKKFFAMLLVASCCFAGSLTVTGPGPIPSSKEDTDKEKIMHQFFQAFTDALKNNLAKSPQSKLKDDWKVTITLMHGTVTLSRIPEFVDVTVAAAKGKGDYYGDTIPYCSVGNKTPEQLAREVYKGAWKYMTTGK